MFDFFKSSLEKEISETKKIRFRLVVNEWASAAGLEITDSSDENLTIFFAVNLADRILDARFNYESRNVDIISERHIAAIYCLLFRIARTACFLMHIENKRIVGDILANACFKFGESINVSDGEGFGSGSYTKPVNDVNAPPVAQDQTVNLNEDESTIG